MDITIRDMQEKKFLVGKEKSLWNPKMKKYIDVLRIEGWKKFYAFGAEKTYNALINLDPIIRDAIKNDKVILFVCTKPKLSNKLKKFCEKFMDKSKFIEVSTQFNYVTNRWIGGTITNNRILRLQIQKFKKLAAKINSHDIESMTRKEQVTAFKEVKKKRKIYEGLLNLLKYPDILFVIDSNYETTAVTEARQKGIYIVGTTNTDGDPTKVDYVIPMSDNHDSLEFLLKYLDSIVMDSIIEIRAFNENLSKEEYLRLQKQREKVNYQPLEVDKTNDNEEVKITSALKTNEKGEVLSSEIINKLNED